MLITVDVNKLLELGITADQYVWLKLMHDSQNHTADRFARLRQQPLNWSKYAVSTEPFVLNKKALRELFQISDSYFWEFYAEFPLKVPGRNGGYRMLKTQREDTQLAKEMKKKYLSKVKTYEHHQHVMRCLKADMDHRKRGNSMQFFPAIEAYINGADWEKAEHLLELGNSVNASRKDPGYGEGLL